MNLQLLYYNFTQASPSSNNNRLNVAISDVEVRDYCAIRRWIYLVRYQNIFYILFRQKNHLAIADIHPNQSWYSQWTEHVGPLLATKLSQLLRSHGITRTLPEPAGSRSAGFAHPWAQRSSSGSGYQWQPGEQQLPAHARHPGDTDARRQGDWGTGGGCDSDTEGTSETGYHRGRPFHSWVSMWILYIVQQYLIS